MLQIKEEDWVFFNQGKANTLYKYVGNDEKLTAKLLRLRQSDQVISTKEVYDYVETEVRPILSEVIAGEIVEVTFQKDDLLNDGYGIIFSNLLPADAELVKKDKYFSTYQNSTQFILELKPKWLWNIEKCRNCANHRYKHGQDPTFCSLDLLDTLKRKNAVNTMSDDPVIQDALLEYFKKDNVLTKLRDCQTTSQNILEVKDITEVTRELCFAMTMRDVTIFITIDLGQRKVSDVVITDTDPKSPTKWKHWASTEKKLVEQGFYKSH